MASLRLLFAVLAICLSEFAIAAADDVQVDIEVSQSGEFFTFPRIPSPAVNDSAADGEWRILSGRVDTNSGSLDVLSDGRIPASADQPRDNWFLAAGTDDGLLLLDLRQSITISQIVSYSWHPGQRAPQLYSVYAASAADGKVEFPDSLEKVATTAGWSLIAQVDTRKQVLAGGQVAARITLTASSAKPYRYLLFVVQSTEPSDRFSHTFFSEIDVISGEESALQRIKAPPIREQQFATSDQLYRFTIDTTQAEELEEWTERELQPVIREWYPRIVQLLPSKDFKAPQQVRLRYLPDSEMKGVPAYASGTTISLNIEWMRGQLKGEARGAVVHELVHVVQQYSGRRRGRAGSVTPGWLVEGIPDYIRWFLYEPGTGGAKLSAKRRQAAQHNASYRVTANFLDYVIRSHPTNPSILEQLNAAAREGRYTPELWQQLTGKTEQELANDWRSAVD